MEVLREEAANTMSTIEEVFPPTSFDMMIHFVIYLVKELNLCDPIVMRWMYPIKWYKKTFKRYMWKYGTTRREYEKWIFH
jgi:hypothetical protein